MVVNQWSGEDPVADRLATSMIDRELYPSGHQNEAWQEGIRAAIATELAEKLPPSNGPENQIAVRPPVALAEVIPIQISK